MTRTGVVTLLILTLVVGIAAWSKLRFVGRDGYDDPQRWRVEEYPEPMGRQATQAGAQGHWTNGG
jgi:hypothetical protein